MRHTVIPVLLLAAGACQYEAPLAAWRNAQMIVANADTHELTVTLVLDRDRCWPLNHEVEAHANDVPLERVDEGRRPCVATFRATRRAMARDLRVELHDFTHTMIADLPAVLFERTLLALEIADEHGRWRVAEGSTFPLEWQGEDHDLDAATIEFYREPLPQWSDGDRDAVAAPFVPGGTVISASVNGGADAETDVDSEGSPGHRRAAWRVHGHRVDVTIPPEPLPLAAPALHGHVEMTVTAEQCRGALRCTARLSVDAWFPLVVDTAAPL